MFINLPNSYFFNEHSFDLGIKGSSDWYSNLCQNGSTFVVCQPLTFANRQWHAHDQRWPKTIVQVQKTIFKVFKNLRCPHITPAINKQSASGNPGDGEYGEVDHPPVVLPREVLRALRRHELDHSWPCLLVNLRQRHIQKTDWTFCWFGFNNTLFPKRSNIKGVIHVIHTLSDYFAKQIAWMQKYCQKP